MSATDLIGLLKESTVHIGSPDHTGTGFFVAPGRVLTCAHVVHGTKSRAKVHVTWKSREVSAEIADIMKDLDLAVLSVEIEGHPCVLLGSEWDLDTQAYAYGYTLRGGLVRGESIKPNLEGESHLATSGGSTLIKLANAQVEPGFSGAPLLNRSRGIVFGIIKSTRDRSTNLGGRAVPWAAAAPHFPELTQANRVFHDSDRRWLTAAATQSLGHSQYAFRASGALIRANGSGQGEVLFQLGIQQEILQRIADQLGATGSARLNPGLPGVTPHFTGRSKIVNRILGLLGSGRMVTVTGVAGIGKTEVARATAHAAVDQSPNWAAEGVLYANLERAGTADAILDELVIQLGLQPSSSLAGIASQLAGARLYVLDDFFPAFSADPRATREIFEALLLYAAPGRFLLTCRAPIIEQRSTILALDRLGAPDDEVLFRSMAEHVGYTWQDNDDVLIQELLRADDGFDGLPLAIVLAAERLRNRSLTRVLRDWRMRRTSSLQTPALRGSELGHLDSVESSIALSYDLLPDTGLVRPLFGLFADLPAGASEELLEGIAPDGVDAADVLERNGLLRFSQSRFTMLYPIRSFAARLGAAVVGPARARLDWYLLETARLWGTENNWIVSRGDAVRRLTIELPNLQTALDRAGERMDDEYISQLTSALARFYPYTVPSAQSAQRLRYGAEAARRINDRINEADCLEGLAEVHWMLDEYENAKSSYSMALRIRSALSDRKGEATCLHGLGEVYRMLNQYSDARAQYVAAQQAFAEVGDRRGEANSLQGLGHVHRMTDDYGEAQVKYRQALQLYREVRDRLGEAQCIRGLGHVHLTLDDYLEARTRYEEALGMHLSLEDRLGVANCIQCLGHVHRRLGENAAALKRYETARQIYGEIHDRIGQAQCARSIGDIHLALEEYPKARACYHDALDIHRAVHDRFGQANCLYGLGIVHAGLGEYAKARASFHEAVQIYDDTEDRLGRANCIQGLADVHLGLGEHMEARACYEEALQIHRVLPNLRGEASSILGLGRISVAVGDYHGAQIQIENARAIFVEINSKLHVAICDMELAGLAHKVGNQTVACTQMYMAASGFLAVGHSIRETRARAFLRALQYPQC